MDELIKEAKKGNPDAFTRLMQSQMQRMYKTALALLRNDADAGDAISETILTCWEKINQLKYEKYFNTWLTKILINKCNDILRQQTKLTYTDEMIEIPFNDTSFENAEWKEALNSLDERYRLVIMLYYVEGFKTGEISQLLEIPESTVRTHLARGRVRLSREYNLDRRKSV